MSVPTLEAGTIPVNLPVWSNGAHLVVLIMLGLCGLFFFGAGDFFLLCNMDHGILLHDGLGYLPTGNVGMGRQAGERVSRGDRHIYPDPRTTARIVWQITRYRQMQTPRTEHASLRMHPCNSLKLEKVGHIMWCSVLSASSATCARPHTPRLSCPTYVLQCAASGF